MSVLSSQGPCKMKSVSSERPKSGYSTMKVYDNEGYNSLDGESTYKTESLIRYRGNSSRSFDKKGLRIKLINDTYLFVMTNK